MIPLDDIKEVLEAVPDQIVAPDPLDTIERGAAVSKMLNQISSAIRAQRTAAVRELVAQGWAPADIARATHLSVGRIRQLADE